MLTKPIYITQYLKVGPLSKLECLPNFSCEPQYLKVGPALKEVAAGHQEEVAAANEVDLFHDPPTFKPMHGDQESESESFRMTK